jgi:hypothetical protein
VGTLSVWIGCQTRCHKHNKVEFLSSLEWFCFDRSAVLNVTQWTVLVARLEVCEVFSTAIRIEFKYQLVVGMFISKEKKSLFF